MREAPVWNNDAKIECETTAGRVELPGSGRHSVLVSMGAVAQNVRRACGGLCHLAMDGYVQAARATRG